jgi:hypothetical protein
MPELQQAEEYQKGEDQSLQKVGDSTDDKELQPIHPVGDYTADGTENKPRCKFKKADETEKKSRFGELPNQPILDDEMYILTGFSREIADSENSEIAIAQGRRKSHWSGVVLSKLLAVVPILVRMNYGETTSDNLPAASRWYITGTCLSPIDTLRRGKYYLSTS